MKFQYSPGLIGYGVKGTDGSAGIQGFAIYFTDYDMIDDRAIVTYALSNNEVLWLAAEPGTKLPGGRVYLDGELFVDSEGNLYEIALDQTDKFIYLGFKFYSVSYFTTDNGAQTTGGWQRVYNIFANLDEWNDVSTKYIIDNVYSNRSIDYENTISELYGISPKNYARIEFVNVDVSSRNPFTVYTSGNISYTDDYKSLALVRDINNNTFRFGNLTNESLRGVDLTFDVSSLRKNSTPISLNTPSGEILSNKEVSCNALFTGVFDKSPASFTATSTTNTDLEINWNLADFTPDSSISANLYVYEKVTNSKPIETMIFHNVSVTDTLTLSDLSTNAIYNCYMKIIKDGWSRNSTMLEVPIDGVPVLPPSVTPMIINASSGGKIEIVTVTSTVNWITTVTSGNSWISCDPVNGTSLDTSFDVSVKPNITLSSRVGYIEVGTYGRTVPTTITINQDASALPPYITVEPALILANNLGVIIGPEGFEGYPIVSSNGNWTGIASGDPILLYDTFGGSSGDTVLTGLQILPASLGDPQQSTTITFTFGSVTAYLHIIREEY